MAQNAKFTHISVTSDEDDDFVIEAGAVDQAPAAEREPEPACADAPAAGESEKPPAASKPAKPAKKADAYSPTTLDDLNGTKMPLAQKMVVVLAVLAIVAFAVWYVTAH